MSEKYRGFAPGRIAPRVSTPTTAGGRSSRFALCALAALLSACASAPAPERTEAASTEAPATAPIEPVADLGAARAASDVPLRADAPLIYTVKKGDTLWGVASYFLDNPWQWPDLWYGNSQIRNPHLIYPGQQLKLVWVNGKPRVTAGDDVAYAGDAGGAEHLSPQIREMPLDGALPTIPIEAIRTFLAGPRLVTERELTRAPYVVAFTDPHLVNGAIAGLFAKGVPEQGDITWAVVHPGGKYVDPDSGKLLGYEAIPVARAEVRRFAPVSELLMTDSYREVTTGDRLLPIEPEHFEANFYPHRPKTNVKGSIISVFDGVYVIPQYTIVALNRGADDGLDPGSVLTIVKAGDRVADPYGLARVQLPDQVGGTMMVFKTTPKVSFALVLSSIRDLHVLDKFAPPEVAHAAY